MLCISTKMKTKLTLVALVALNGALCLGQTPPAVAPTPAPVQTVLFAATPEKPYTITALTFREFTDVQVTNNASSRMQFAARLANLGNVDTASSAARIFRPLQDNVVWVNPGESALAKRVFAANSTLPITFDYSLDYMLAQPQKTFDVGDPIAARRAHPMPPPSEWSKLPNEADAMARGTLEPFAWYMTPSGRPAQAMNYKTVTNAEIGRQDPAEAAAEINEAMRKGENVDAVRRKQRLNNLRGFQRTLTAKDPKVRNVYADGKVVEHVTKATDEAFK